MKHRLKQSITGGVFKCFVHNRFLQILFSSQLSQDSLPRENHPVITYSLNFLGIFKQKALECSENMLTLSKVYRFQANQSE